MIPSAPQVRSLVCAACERPKELTSDDLHGLAGAILLTLREDDSGLSAQYSELTGGNDVQQDVVECLANLPVNPTNPTIEPLLFTFERDQQFYEAMHALIALTIPEVTGTISRRALGPMQIEVLTRLVTSDAIWEHDTTLRDRLTARGLPVSRHKLRLMLATIS